MMLTGVPHRPERGAREVWSTRLRAGVTGAAVACAWAASACGGLLQPIDAGPEAGVLDAGEASTDADASEAEDGDAGADGEPCILDASDDTPLCTPPADDLLYGSPGVVDVAAGSYGVANFIATGPWASDPMMYMHFESSTVPLLDHPAIETYGTPQALIFEVPSSAAGQQGTIYVSGHEGNIARTAQVSVNVTSCVPWAPATACPGIECGFQPDNCGGLVSCGTCSGATPYCYLGVCISSQPHPCPAGEGFQPDGGACLPCPLSQACKDCALGTCISSDSMCICYTTPGG